jgi:hypothetical protein
MFRFGYGYYSVPGVLGGLGSGYVQPNVMYSFEGNKFGSVAEKNQERAALQQQVDRQQQQQKQTVYSPPAPNVFSAAKRM